MNKPSGLTPNSLAMQRYFDELLGLDVAENTIPHPAFASSAVSQADSQVSSQLAPTKKQQVELPHRDVEDVEQERQTQQALEVLQKQKLQALLDQQHIQRPKKVELKPTPIPPQVFSVPVPTQQEEFLDENTQVNVPELLCWHENGRPLWAQNEFDVLLFEVSGLTLAVPLIALGQILYLNESLTPIFGQSDWFMGLLPSPRGTIKTVNTALFVMPERYDDKFLHTARFVISIDGLPWGLAVDSVNQPSRIHPDAVKWRSNRTKRPWLAGTVKSAMCALIDIPQMGKLLMDSEK